jgi:hypothetical protein
MKIEAIHLFLKHRLRLFYWLTQRKLKGSSTPNRVSVGSITKAQLEEIANIKLPDLNTTKLSSAMKIVEGTKNGYLHCRLNQN